MTSSAVPFYSRPSLHVEIYDIQTAGWDAGQKDAEFYLDEAKSTGGPALELGCGTGRITFPLLSTGFEVHGLDASSAMLEVAQKKRAALPAETAQRLHLHLGDMSQFDLGKKFAFIFIAFRSFQILTTPETQRQCLACIRRHLAPGGKVIINLFDPRYDLILPGVHPGTGEPREFTHPISGNSVLVETLERLNDPMTQTMQETWRFTETLPTGKVVRQEEEIIHLRWTFRQEMRHLIESSGFVVEAEYSNFQRSAPAYGKEQIWVLKTA